MTTGSVNSQEEDIGCHLPHVSDNCVLTDCSVPGTVGHSSMPTDVISEGTMTILQGDGVGYAEPQGGAL